MTRRTPSTYPRTKASSSTSQLERRALENLRQQLSFSDMDEVKSCIYYMCAITILQTTIRRVKHIKHKESCMEAYKGFFSKSAQMAWIAKVNEITSATCPRASAPCKCRWSAMTRSIGGAPSRAATTARRPVTASSRPATTV